VHARFDLTRERNIGRVDLGHDHGEDGPTLEPSKHVRIALRCGQRLCDRRPRRGINHPVLGHGDEDEYERLIESVGAAPFAKEHVTEDFFVDDALNALPGTADERD
jgi:hypothetical protein